MWQALLSPITSVINNVVGRIVGDKDLALKLQTEITSEAMKLGKAELQGAIDIILAEAKGDSWLQRNWRPLLMVSIIAIVVNNFLFVPYLKLFGIPSVILDLPDHLYNLMTVGVGGYVMGRSGEKMVKAWKEKE